MTCSKCGASLVATARFCGECGTPVADARGEQAPSGATPAGKGSPVRSPAAMAQTIVGSGADAAAAVARSIADARIAAASTRTPGAVPSVTPEPPRADPSNLVGVVLNNRYRVIARIGEGGFGAVYRGEQIAMGRECAIKVLHPRMAKDPQVVGRFRREAQAASVLRDPHTVATYDFDQTAEGILYMAMELLHGRSLHTEMGQGPMAWRRVAHVLSGVLESLAEAHGQGIVHRDIKPENIYLEVRGSDRDYAKVLDFGIAKIISGEGHSAGPQLTAAGQTLGTIEYMSPEQLMGQALDGRSDLYAIGNLAYEMLCGALPFANLRTPGELITAHLRSVPRAPSEVRPDLRIPRALDQAVLRMMEKQRDNRFRDAAEARDALQRVMASATEAEVVLQRGLAEEAPTQPDLRPLKVPPAGPPATAVADTPSVPAQVPRSQGGLYVAAGVLFLIIAAAAAWFLFMPKAGAAKPPRPTTASASLAPAWMVPDRFDALLSVDLPALRAAAPAQSLGGLLEALRPPLAEVGADPEHVGKLAFGVGGPRSRKVGGQAAAESMVLVVDVQADPKKLEAAAARRLPVGDRFVDASASGVRYRRSAAGSYALLGGQRVALGVGKGFAEALGRSGGLGSSQPGGLPGSLINGRAAPLLARVGVTRGQGAPSFGWARFDEAERKRMDARLPGVAAVQEIADVVQVGAGGADLKVLGSCATADGAKAAASALQAGLAQLRQHPMVSILGVGRMLDAVIIGSDGATVTLDAHLTPAQFGDLVGRLGSAVAAMAEPPIPPEGPSPAPAIAPRATGLRSPTKG